MANWAIGGLDGRGIWRVVGGRGGSLGDLEDLRRWLILGLGDYDGWAVRKIAELRIGGFGGLEDWPRRAVGGFARLGDSDDWRIGRFAGLGAQSSIVDQSPNPRIPQSSGHPSAQYANRPIPQSPIRLVHPTAQSPEASEASESPNPRRLQTSESVEPATRPTVRTPTVRIARARNRAIVRITRIP